MTPSTSQEAPAVQIPIKRMFTTAGEGPYHNIEWERRTARIGQADNPRFEQRNVEVPSFWSQNATDIVASKYFAYGADDPRREDSVRTLIDRIVTKLADEGMAAGYFGSADREIFLDELRYIMVHQLAAFNSPVQFNIGVEGVPQVASACFILSVEDSIKGIGQWYMDEMEIFKSGSGAGANLSKLRGSSETLSRGGVSSGPVSFMRGADASAGTIQSGGRTRRAAKLVRLDVDHPDIEEFIVCKVREEERIRALAAAGITIGIGSEAGERELAEATAYQNANQSVGLSDDFMAAVERDADWDLLERQTGNVAKTVKARDIMNMIAESAWSCADPGVQFDTIINDWHTTPAQGPITASNPCSEYLSNDDSACNLSSVNLLKFLNEDGSFDTDGFRQTVAIMFLGQEITLAFADFPTRKIGKNTRALRQIGLGYANLGALLMAKGQPYDSEDGRETAAAITALLTGQSYLTSTAIAERMGAFDYYKENADSVQRVLGKHKAAADALAVGRSSNSQTVREAKKVWTEVLEEAAEHGVRNAQATVLAPTGTISFLMDCDTTGIEPDLSLIKHKTLVGGGTMAIINQIVPEALKRLGYDTTQVSEIMDYLEEDVDGSMRGHLVGAPHISEEHVHVFDCAMGAQTIAHMGHVNMMAAVQPFLSGAISKTVNLPPTATPADIAEVYQRGWELGLKALAVYRDGSKNSQPLATSKGPSGSESEDEARATSLLGDGLLRGERRRVAREPAVASVNFNIGQVGGYIHVRLFDDGTPGAVFVDVGQAGSTLHGFIRAWAITMSLGLQYGLPLDTLVSKLAWTQFEPQGITDDPDIRTARSIVDYAIRWMAARFLDLDELDRGSLGLQPLDSTDSDEVVQVEAAIPGGEIIQRRKVVAQTRKITPQGVIRTINTAEICPNCGAQAMVRTGSCMTCSVCGENSGCG